MGYVAPTWQNGGPPALNAKNMQDISDNLAYVSNHMVNPNLLDNWYFGNPVNQRGQTSYTGTGIYAIDRWMTDSTVTVVDGGIKCKQSGHEWLLWQKLDDALAKIIAGRVVTYSALTSAGLLTKTVSLPPLNETWDIEGGNATLGDLAMDMTQLGGKKCLRLYSEVYDTEAIIKAAKLELGSQQTLAHKEYGEWVLNEIPKFGDQLAECQRYFVRIGSDNAYRIVGTGTAYGTTMCGIIVPLPVEMRTVPAVSIVGQLMLRNKAGAEVVCSGVALDVIGAATAYLNCTASGLTIGASYDAYLQPGNYLSFSADL